MYAVPEAHLVASIGYGRCAAPLVSSFNKTKFTYFVLRFSVWGGLNLAYVDNYRTKQCCRAGRSRCILVGTVLKVRLRGSGSSLDEENKLYSTGYSFRSFQLPTLIKGKLKRRLGRC